LCGKLYKNHHLGTKNEKMFGASVIKVAHWAILLDHKNPWKNEGVYTPKNMGKKR